MDYIKIKFKNDFDQQVLKSGRVLEDMFRAINPLFSMTERTLKPQTDVFETQKEIEVLAEIAGVDPKELEIEVSRKTIKIKGIRRQMLYNRKGGFRLAEIQYGAFERAFILPARYRPGYGFGNLRRRNAPYPVDQPVNVFHRPGHQAPAQRPGPAPRAHTEEQMHSSKACQPD